MKFVDYRRCGMALDDLLQKLLDDARTQDGRASRRRRRILRTLAEESATLQGALVDLAERGTTVALRTTDGQAHRGAIRLVGGDFAIVGSAAGDTWVAVSAIDSVRPSIEERHGAATGDRPAVDILLGDALGKVAPERPVVTIRTAGGDSVVGELRAVGSDVVSVELDGPGRPLCYVSLPSVLTVGFLRSG
jgi:hypothetical protein